MIVSNGPVFSGGHKNICSMCAKVLAVCASVINIVFGIILLVLLYRSDYYDGDNDNDFPDNGTRYGYRGNRKWLTVAAAYLIFVGFVILSIEIPCVWALRCMPCFQNYVCRGVTYVVGSVVGFIASYGWIGSVFFLVSGILYMIAGCLGASGTLPSTVF